MKLVAICLLLASFSHTGEVSKKAQNNNLVV